MTMPARIRCHVFEVPTPDDWLSRRGGGPRELLPWADPYIAGLMRRLENRYAHPNVRDWSDPFESDEPTTNGPWCDDGWQEDAFMPRPLEARRFYAYPPIYGGFPLLEDREETNDFNLE
jgi:hypothetical protein